MDVRITPGTLGGEVVVPPSKSVSHRALICAALASGDSTLHRVLKCEDTDATIDALRAFGASIQKDRDTLYVSGINQPPTSAEVDCRESGSTLRFLIPVAAALGIDATFKGCGKLPERPVTPFIDEFPKHGAEFLSVKMPYKISGRLTSGVFPMAGDISSQFITGLLLASPLMEGTTTVRVTTPLQSRPYAYITLSCMNAFGVETLEYDNNFTVKGRYAPTEYTVEGDCSQAAFFAVANCLGSSIDIRGLNPDSVQGDKAIFDIIDGMIKIGDKYSGFDTDASDIPDLVPILTVLACFADGHSRIRGCGRLRLKESDRLMSISTVLNSLGGKVTVDNDELLIEGVQELSGGVCSSFNDHRIAMSLAIASTRCTSPLTITGAECVAKSYPGFFEDFAGIGGKVEKVD